MIIAVDFDGTLYDREAGKQTKEFYKVFTFLVECKERGYEVVLYSARGDMQFAIDWCKERELPIDRVEKKMTYDLIIEDKAMLPWDLDFSWFEDAENGV